MSDQAQQPKDSFGVPSDASLEPLTPAQEASPLTSQAPPLAALFKFPPNGQLVVGKASSLHAKDRNYLLVGRQVATCDIRISHKSLSRQHAVLYYTTTQEPESDFVRYHLWVKDLGTKSGTFLNNERLAANVPVELQMGDSIQLGKAQPLFTVEWDGGKNQKVPETTKPEKEKEHEESEGPALTGREQRQKEIEAMMASLDETPTYSKYVPENDGPKPSARQNLPAHADPSQSIKAKQATLMEKHKLPLTDFTDPAVMDSSVLSVATMDPSGARFALGSMDSTLRLYDFGGYNASQPTPFANNYIQEGYPMRCIGYSPSGDRFVVATASAQPRLMDREGEEVLQFVRGDVYVTDPQKTSGHTATVTAVQWHPAEKSIVFTTSRDGSLRVWNVDKGKLAFSMLKSDDVIVVKGLKTGRKTIPTCLSMTPQHIAVGTECGSLQIYQYPFVSKLRPQQSTLVDDGKNSIHCLQYSPDTNKLACRTTQAVYVYDVSKRLSTSSIPLLKCDRVGDGDSTDSGNATIAFSPNSKTLCIAIHENGRSQLDMYTIPKESKSKPAVPIVRMPLPDEMVDPIAGIHWQTRLNQLLVATTKAFQIWYSASHSQKGVLLSSGRRKKRQMEDDLQDFYQSKAPPPGSNVRYEEIQAPNALPLFGGDSHKLRKKQKQEAEDSRQHPQQPAKSVYNTPNTIFAQLVVDNQTVDQKIIAGKDPRAALAKYSEGKSYISSAYEGNKERILADRTVEEEEDEMKGGK